MALNGLDSSTVSDAYRAALDESGGWLLLSYTSRDEVDIFQRGNNGIVELSEALSEYPSRSPLYGFFQYRKKKVILKYIPEGTSRLLQARTSVHWSSVTDAFPLHDALLEATNPTDLDEAALSTLCGLPPPESAPPAAPAPPTAPSPLPPAVAAVVHAQSPSPVPSESIRKTPSFDERPSVSRSTNRPGNAFGDTTPRAHTRTPNPESKDSTIISSPSRNGLRDPDHGRDSPMDGEQLHRPRTQPNSQPRYEPRSRDAINLAAFLNEVPPPSVPFAPKHNSPDLREFSPSPDSAAHRSSHDVEPPSTSYSSRSGRPSTSDIWRSFKPKLKLHPRPVEPQANSAQQPSSVRQKLPSGLKMKPRKTDKSEPERPKSRKSEKGFAIMTSANAPPRTSSRHTQADRRARSPEEEEPLPPLPPEIEAEKRQARSNGAVAAPGSPSPEALPDMRPSKLDSPNIGYSEGRRAPKNLGIDTVVAQTTDLSETIALLSPEKQRLMKALELRKKQLNASAQPRGSSDSREHVQGSIGSSKTDSGVDIEEMRAAQSEQSRSRMQLASASPYAAPTSRTPQAARRHNPALQSHPIGGVEDFASPPAQPPLPPPPKDLPPPPKELPPPPPGGDDERPGSRDTGEDPRRRQDKRRGFVRQLPSEKPTPNLTPHDSSDAVEDYESQHDFIKELESATVQEAATMAMPVKKIGVVASSSRSATPVMIARSGSRRKRSDPPEITTGLQEKNSPSPPSPEPQRPSTSAEASARSRINVSTGISRRIQALAELSGRDGQPLAPYQVAQSAPEASQSFLAPGALPPADSGSKQSILARSYDESRTTSPSRSVRRVLPRRQSNESQRTMDTVTGKKKDTVSITAHIQQPPHGSRPLVIDEDGQEHSPVDFSRPMHSRTISRTSTSRTGEQRPGSSHSNRPVSRGSTLTSFTRTSLDVYRSGGTRKYQSSLRPPTSLSNVSLDRVDEVSEPRSSRTSKLLKRMSGFGSSKQKQPSDAESLPSMEDRKMLSPPRPTSMIVGDLNVQFPDTLLWKRRWVEVDGSGNLVLSASPSRDRPNGSRKKYHLSDFKMPSAPGQDRQELPHSVVLDFIGGGGSLQLATEDPIGQASILRRIGDAHRAWLYYET